MSENKYYIIENGTKLGPFSIEELKTKNIHPHTLVWYDGLKEWQKACEIQSLRVVFYKQSNKYQIFIILILLVVIIYNINTNNLKNIFNNTKNSNMESEDTIFKNIIQDADVVEDIETNRKKITLHKLV
jgi:hypothetical protein